MRWVPYVSTTINAGSCTEEEFRKGLLEVERKAGRFPDVIYGCEFGDRADLKRLLVRMGYGIIEDRAPGAASTPLFYWQTMAALDATWDLLLPRTWAPGVGPDWTKPKGLNRAELRHKLAGRRIRCAPWHGPAPGKAKRRALAERGVRGILRVFVFRVIQECGGDFNMTRRRYPDFIRWLTRAGWTTSDLEHGSLLTHGDQLYDVIAWPVHTLIRSVGHFTTDFGSDHLAKTSVKEIRVTRRIARRHARKAGL